jgi:hypothetical protein
LSNPESTLCLHLSPFFEAPHFTGKVNYRLGKHMPFTSINELPKEIKIDVFTAPNSIKWLAGELEDDSFGDCIFQQNKKLRIRELL